MDVPRSVPCLPGAELTETLGDEHWRTRMALTLGPFVFVFDTDLERVEADEERHRATLLARGRELRGRGSATARIEPTLAPSAEGTSVRMVTELELSGTVARHGPARMMRALSAELVAGFAANLARELARSRAGASGREAALGVDVAMAGGPAPVSGVRLAARALGRELAPPPARAVARGFDRLVRRLAPGAERRKGGTT
jgi:carbon monoxide dehydrogenase subunit G